MKPAPPKAAWQAAARARSKTCGARAQPGRHRLASLRAPRVARTPQTQPGSWREEAGSGAKQRRLAPRYARRSDARFGSPRCALRASLGRVRRSRPVGGRKPAAPQAAWLAAAPARSNAAWLGWPNASCWA
jgi:hypothetical protein